MAKEFRSWAAQQRAPSTVFLVVSLVGLALVSLFGGARTVQALALTDPEARPWGFLTYPWAYSPLVSPLGLVFLAFFVMWLLQFGTSVERDLGTPRFVGFWLVFTLLPALVAVAMRVGLAEPWLPTGAVVIAWCARNRGASLRFWGIPVNAPILAAIVAVSVLIPYASLSPAFGLLMLVPLGLAWAFGGDLLPLAYSGTAVARRREPVVRGGTKYDESYFENVKDREIEREERERLRKLFEGK